jgi:hypothetical protein
MIKVKGKAIERRKMKYRLIHSVDSTKFNEQLDEYASEGYVIRHFEVLRDLTLVALMEGVDDDEQQSA